MGCGTGLVVEIATIFNLDCFSDQPKKPRMAVWVNTSSRYQPIQVYDSVTYAVYECTQQHIWARFDK